MTNRYFIIGATGAAIVLSMLFFLVLFEPGLLYEIPQSMPSVESPDFLALLPVVMDAPARSLSDYKVLTDGDVFYQAELETIRQARSTIHLEAFIFHDSAIGERFIAALAERAAAGVKVRVIVDAFGSMLTPDLFFERLRKAGGEVVWYQPLRWYTLKRYNNRTHRELLIVDGNAGFIGGAGIGSAWDKGENGERPWRDTMVHVTGPIVTGLQTGFVQNWLESSGAVLADTSLFPHFKAYKSPTADEDAPGMVIASTPTAARGTRCRMLFQMLIAGARNGILINSPYFVPDRAMRRELMDAVKRGVKVTVVVPGEHNNHPATRLASRRRYGELLAHGIQIYEYVPGMIHAKIMIIDNLWSVVGSTNFDNRSFGLNDEINLVVRNEGFAARLSTDFERDRGQSRNVTLDEWLHRSYVERALAMIGSLFERQE